MPIDEDFEDEAPSNTVVVEVGKGDTPEDMIGTLATVITAAIDSFCGHPATGEYSYGHVLAALTCSMAVKMKQSGVVTEEQIENAGDEFRAALINSIKAIFTGEANERKANRQEN
jgi:hypothetical protein